MSALWFTAPRKVELREAAPAPLPEDGLRVRTEVSLTSAIAFAPGDTSVRG